MTAADEFRVLSEDEMRRRRSAKWADAAPDVLRASYAEMDFALPPFVQRSLSALAAAEDLGYPTPAAEHAVIEALRARADRCWSWSITAWQARVVNDVMQGLGLALACAPPDAPVVLIEPAYPPYFTALAALGRSVRTVRLAPAAQGWRLDLQALADAATGAAALLICNPHNPTGSVLSEAELEAIADIAARTGALLVSDEIFMDLTHAPARHHPLLPFAMARGARAIALCSAAKAFNVPGARCAVAIATDEDTLRRFDAAGLGMRGALNATGLAVTRAAWEADDAWLGAARTYLKANRDVLYERMLEVFPDALPCPPAGAYLAWLDFRALGLAAPDAAFADLAKVEMFGGQHFGAGWEGYVRLNYATSRPVLERMLERLSQALSAISRRGGRSRRRTAAADTDR